LNSLVHSLRVLLGAALGGVSPVVQSGGHYRLNEAAGVAVDVVRFQTLVARGERLERGGQLETAIEVYQRAARLHAGDLITSAGDGAQVGLERERLRALYRRVLIRLADHAFARSDYNGCLEHARQLLARDPCREDAHRLVMRCHVRLAERSQALRHYHTARAILRTELDTEPEPATIALFEQIRLDPSAV
jgi:DNA-binding SARP family transcriptional activator